MPTMRQREPVNGAAAAAVRIRPGQRKLIFATAGRVGLRDEQLHDLVESVSDYRTRAIARLTMAEARHLIAILKRFERGGRAGAAPPPAAAPAASEDLIACAVERGRAGERPA